MRPFPDNDDKWEQLVQLTADEQAFHASVPSVSAWTVGQQLDHIAKSLYLIGRTVGKLLRTEEQRKLSGPNAMGRLILMFGKIPRGKAKAPDMVQPREQAEMENTRKTMERARVHWEKLNERDTEIKLSRAVSPHHLLGNMNASQWTRFAAIHTKHHLDIIVDILSGQRPTGPRTEGAQKS